MTKRRKDPAGPWSPMTPNKKSAGSPALNLITYQSNYLDPHVAARHHRERLTEKLSKFASKELTPVKKRKGLPK